jgi:hypothetical protein
VHAYFKGGEGEEDCVCGFILTTTHLVMVYSCPDGSGNTKSAPVRQRMLYSSSKANIENVLTSIGGKADVKIEVNQGDEVTQDNIDNQLHPPKEVKKEVCILHFPFLSLRQEDQKY